MTRLPLFPLGTVLFPGLPLPLQVFEQRYRRMVSDLQDREPGERQFGVIGIRAGFEVGTQDLPRLHEIGCVAELRRVVDHGDGITDILSIGVGRFRLLATADDDDGLAIGDVEFLDEPEGPDDPALADHVRVSFADYVRAVRATRGLADDETPELPPSPCAVSFAVASAALLTMTQKQQLLAAPTVADRLRLELTLLGQETGFARDMNTLPGVVMPRVPFSQN